MPDNTRAKKAALGTLNAAPSGERNPVFNEPWEAQAFALTLALHRRGVFSWEEWAATLGQEIKQAQANGDPDTGTTYYRHWLAAIERLVQQKGIANESTLIHYREAWNKAADRTPHGLPIMLTPEDLS